MKRILLAGVIFVSLAPVLMAQGTTLIAPQLTVGSEGPGQPYWVTTVFFENTSGEGLNIAFGWFTPAGSEMSLGYAPSGRNPLPAQSGWAGISPNRGFRFELTHEGSLQTGWIQLEINGPMPLVSVEYRRISPEGEILTSIAVTVGETATEWETLVRSTQREDLGLALVNPGPETVEVRLDLYIYAFPSVHTTVVTLPPRGQRAVFLRELFPELPPDDGLGDPVSQGSLRIVSPTPIAVTALQGMPR